MPSFTNKIGLIMALGEFKHLEEITIPCVDTGVDFSISESLRVMEATLECPRYANFHVKGDGTVFDILASKYPMLKKIFARFKGHSEEWLVKRRDVAEGSSSREVIKNGPLMPEWLRLASQAGSFDRS